VPCSNYLENIDCKECELIDNNLTIKGVTIKNYSLNSTVISLTVKHVINPISIK